MGKWRGFLDSLATTGGHIAVLLFLIVLGAFLTWYGETRGLLGMEKVGEATILGPAVGALFMMYKSAGTNSEQIARAGVPYQPPQPPKDALHPAITVAEAPLPPSTEGAK
jgi:hypothetical protein